MGRRGIVLVVAAIVIVVVLVAVVATVGRSSQGGGQEASVPDEAQTFSTTPTPRPAPTATAAARQIASVIPTNVARPTPQEEIFHGCPGEGDGTDPELNRLKNRIDSPQSPAGPIFSALETLAWPQGVDKKHMQSWAPADRAQVEKYNGIGIAMEAFLIRVQDEGPESNNCHMTDPANVDYHVWIVGRQQDDRDQAIVIEMNPRLRATHPAWNLQNLRKIANARQHVRVTGWIMLDPEHPDQVGKTRGTIWEIHPVTKLEVDAGGGQWQVVDK